MKLKGGVIMAALSRIKYVACARVLIHSFWSKEDLRSNVRGLL
jgi:hypothetical protein